MGGQDESKRVIGLVGGRGFVGSEIATRIDELGYQVRELPRVPLSGALSGGVRAGGRMDDISKEYAECLDGLSVVVNAAGLALPDSVDEDRLVNANAVLPSIVVLAAGKAGVGRVVHVSSAAVLGGDGTVDARPATSAVSAYGRSKALGEQWAASAADKSNVRLCVYRPTSVQSETRSTTRRLVKVLSSRGLPSFGSAPLPLASLASVGALATHLATSVMPPPLVVNHPWEFVTQRNVGSLLGGRSGQLDLPAVVARSFVVAGRGIVGRVPRLQGSWQRTQLILQGQSVDSSSSIAAGFAIDEAASQREFERIGTECRKRLELV